MATQTRKRRGFFGGLLAVLAVLLVIVLYLGLVPPSFAAPAAHALPAASYDDAAAGIAALQAAEAAAGLNPLCQTQFLTHGHKTARVIAFVHGYTNCPQQFVPLGQKFFDLGYNVLIVPLPHHGLADRLTLALSDLTAEDMTNYVNRVVDLEQGLGDYTSLAGLSGGGVITAWAAQTRADLDQAVLIAPGFALKAIPQPATVLFTNAVLLAPDRYTWWDPVHQAAIGGPPYAYPRFSLHGLAQQLRLGFAIRDMARETPPAAGSIVLITNAFDEAVDNAAARQVAADWQAHGASLTTYEFPITLLYGHDLIDPNQANQHVDQVYPKLIELINQ